MISATSSTPAAAPSSPSSAANKPATEKGDLETFLKMLTTQIKNQDPLNPMEGSDFALQLATFSGVEQQVRSNQLLEAMAGGGGAAGLAQYASWIGKEARSTAPATFSGAPIALDVTADAAADRIVLVARDSYGRIASQTEMGPGSGPVDWVGQDASGVKLPHGAYTFEVESWKGETKLSTARAESYTRVTEAETGPAGVVLVLESGARVPASSVSALRDRV